MIAWVDFVKTSDEAKIPQKGIERAAGYDVFSAEDGEIAPQTIGKINSGVKISKISQNIYLQILSRSSIALNNSCITVCGVIDQNYRGNIYVLLYNTSRENSFKIKKGDRIGQIVLMPMIKLRSNTISKDPIKKGKRKTLGFGSTNKGTIGSSNKGFFGSNSTKSTPGSSNEALLDLTQQSNT